MTGNAITGRRSDYGRVHRVTQDLPEVLVFQDLTDATEPEGIRDRTDLLGWMDQMEHWSD